MKRQGLVRRIVGNIKRKLSEVNAQIINEYFDHLQNELLGVCPENIWNFDETAFLDDPGKRKFVVKRGVKYSERVINATKVSYSIMVCGNGVGEMMPPYTVHKASNLYID